LIWEIGGGEFPIGPFLIESTIANEQIPFTYQSTFRVETGTLTLTFICSTEGPGAADVEISAASMTVTRVIGNDQL
jgi:hypothetical protein